MKLACIILSLPPASVVEVIESDRCVWFCVCVCVCVCVHSHDWTVWPMTLIFGMWVELDLRQVGIVGQGHRSKVKVTRSKMWFPRFFPEGTSVYYSNCYWGVCVNPSWQKDFRAKGLYMRGTREVRECLGVFITRYSPLKRNLYYLCDLCDPGFGCYKYM